MKLTKTHHNKTTISAAFDRKAAPTPEYAPSLPLNSDLKTPFLPTSAATCIQAKRPVLPNGAGATPSQLTKPAANLPKSSTGSGLFLVGQSSDGYLVFDRPRSHHHLCTDLLLPVVRRARLGGEPFVKLLIPFEFEIGRSTCVSTDATDVIVYARRPGRAGPTRFVMNRQAVACSTAVAIFKRMQDSPNGYLLITAFVGEMPEPEPWDVNATPASGAFWANHALVWNSCEVLGETMTEICPWAS